MEHCKLWLTRGIINSNRILAISSRASTDEIISNSLHDDQFSPLIRQVSWPKGILIDQDEVPLCVAGRIPGKRGETKVTKTKGYSNSRDVIVEWSPKDRGRITAIAIWRSRRFDGDLFARFHREIILICGDRCDPDENLRLLDPGKRAKTARYRREIQTISAGMRYRPRYIPNRAFTKRDIEFYTLTEKRARVHELTRSHLSDFHHFRGPLYI